MRRYRRNADRELRELERRAAQGDEQAEDALARARIRAGLSTLSEEVSRAVIRRGPICGWSLVWDFPGVLVLSAPGDLGNFIWAEATPYLEGHKGVPVQVRAADYGVPTVDLPDWPLPNLDSIVGIAEAYRNHAQLAFGRLAASLLARATGVCSCSTHVERQCPTHGEIEDVIGP